MSIVDRARTTFRNGRILRRSSRSVRFSRSCSSQASSERPTAQREAFADNTRRKHNTRRSRRPLNKLTNSSLSFVLPDPRFTCTPPHLLLFLLFFDSCTFLLVVAFGWQGGGRRMSARVITVSGLTTPESFGPQSFWGYEPRRADEARQTYRRPVLFSRGLVISLIRLLSGCGEDERLFVLTAIKSESASFCHCHHHSCHPGADHRPCPLE